jgi:hypothetical protein
MIPRAAWADLNRDIDRLATRPRLDAVGKRELRRLVCRYNALVCLPLSWTADAGISGSLRDHRGGPSRLN